MKNYPTLAFVVGSISLLLAVAVWINTNRLEKPSWREDFRPPRPVEHERPVPPAKTDPPTEVVKADSPPMPESAAEVMTEEELQAVVLADIHEAAISYDASELTAIQKYLLDGDPLIREAARDGILTLGSAAGAPLLRKAAALAGDPREAVALLDAADYLELPSADLEKLLKRKKAAN